MMTTSRVGLLSSLAELGELYPDMRFGQLVCFACSIADEAVPGLPEETTDETVLAAVQDHLARRRQELGLKAEIIPVRPATRSQILQAMKSLAEQHPDWSIGQLSSKIAALAHVNLYDIEDGQMLEVIRSNNPGLQWFEWYVNRLEERSTICERRDKPSYRCPCCRCLTLCERGGFDICPVCYWEDDGQDDPDAETVRGGPNGSLSLTLARENYAQHGVCDPKFVEHVRPPRRDEV